MPIDIGAIRNVRDVISTVVRRSGDHERHHIGVRVERQIEVLDIDQNYFTDEE